MKKIILLFSVLLLLSSCVGGEGDSSYPVDPETRRRESLGKLTGDGIVLFGGGSRQTEAASVASGIPINSYLWRAALDTFSFMPLSSADPFGGVIITDWYEDSNARGERFKMTITIMGKYLRANAIKVSVFKQVEDARGKWVDSPVTPDVATKLEDKILTRARQLRIGDQSLP
jgi:hypothetical protein